MTCLLCEDEGWVTTAMMASAMPAAIRPYSIAVAPDSSLCQHFFAGEVQFTGEAYVCLISRLADPREHGAVFQGKR
jgi:hypothetical protein